MKKVYLIVYDTFALFEVVLVNFFLGSSDDVFSIENVVKVGINNNVVTSWEGYKVIPDITLDQLEINNVKALIIPGGKPDQLYKCDKFYQVLKKANSQNILIGGICSGTIHMAEAGVLKNKHFTTPEKIDKYNFDPSKYVHKDVVVDQNAITSTPKGYVEFAIEIGKKCNNGAIDKGYMDKINMFNGVIE